MKFIVPFPLSSIDVLIKAGYQYHWTGNGFIRFDSVGRKGSRFHAKVKNNEIDIHYDKVQKEGYHSAAPKPAKIRIEINRIKHLSFIKRG